jgi:transposase-like protein|tara:strand:+ start:3713 stop:4210 length:498 start_codon:yes stop_codon:yes gene_type:complete
MSKYSAERKAAVMIKLLPPQNSSVVSVAQHEGISEQTLYNWLKQARRDGVVVPGSRKHNSHQWSGEARLAAVLEAASLNEAELSEYCRRKGLYKEQIAQWRQDCIDGAASAEQRAVTDATALKSSQQEVKQLHKELRRKEKALAESAALLVLQKKFQALWEDEDQ